MKLDLSTIRTLERLVGDEVALCEQYLKILSEEERSVIKLEAEKITAMTTDRSEIIERLELARGKRVEFVSKLAGDPGATLTRLVTARTGPGDRKRLMPLIQRLKDLAAKIEEKTREFSQVVDFSLGLVNGSLSILWSATQNVTRCYNAFGGVTELVQPVTPRSGSLLGKA